ncbi:luciferase [Hyphomicrobium denitrificans 1NES1]|uniref:Luciferase n=1 Tax=Hyphomicrobium denitrificans 1NES1 TaxID=670307 RepID=N0B9P0_9HYPH|nr:luciferase [Hyphomicrobium denitrificans 1NES1]
MSAFFGFLPPELLNRSLTPLSREVRPRVEQALEADGRTARYTI